MRITRIIKVKWGTRQSFRKSNSANTPIVACSNSSNLRRMLTIYVKESLEESAKLASIWPLSFLTPTPYRPMHCTVPSSFVTFALIPVTFLCHPSPIKPTRCLRVNNESDVFKISRSREKAQLNCLLSISWLILLRTWFHWLQGCRPARYRLWSFSLVQEKWRDTCAMLQGNDALDKSTPT